MVSEILSNGHFLSPSKGNLTLEQVIKEVHKVSPEDVGTVARQIFENKIINLALIGPLAKSEKQIYGKLNLG